MILAGLVAQIVQSHNQRVEITGRSGKIYVTHEPKSAGPNFLPGPAAPNRPRASRTPPTIVSGHPEQCVHSVIHRIYVARIHYSSDFKHSVESPSGVGVTTAVAYFENANRKLRVSYMAGDHDQPPGEFLSAFGKSLRSK
jgi:hypothetical protein